LYIIVNLYTKKWMKTTDIQYFKSLSEYAVKKSIDYRTVKTKVNKGELLFFLIRKKKVFVESKELWKILYSKNT